jgi:hypothetical protein
VELHRELQKKRFFVFVTPITKVLPHIWCY